MATCQICKYAGTPSYKSPCSECKGYSKYEYKKMQSNADLIRAMSDEELVKMFYHGIEVQYCKNDPACSDLLDTAEGIPEENCKMCLLKWLQQPADTHDNPDLLDEK